MGDSQTPWLVSRILVTWVELVVVGFGGTALGGAVSGPPELIVYFATVLVSVAVLLYNVDQLIQQRLAADTAG
ncbi:MAG: hypothetical protein J07HN6_01653 [Halonotius sp. J07HN6]|nr:MAG: hypothetical protein J07HN6_01653 [Halonotius sp. J07HN6]ERH05526.1 MAG: hypothetical protein J07HN4v3_01127 [Halonotius sp. J07HN4]